jgi:hypothetical protein
VLEKRHEMGGGQKTFIFVITRSPGWHQGLMFYRIQSLHPLKLRMLGYIVYVTLGLAVTPPPKVHVGVQT